MNINGNGFGGRLGDQYIPPAYKALVLPTELQRIRTILFGARPDRVMYNYRAQQLLAMLAATELGGFVTDLDPRITYDVRDDSFFSSQNFGARVSPTDKVWVTGDLGTSDVSGICVRAWQLAATSDTQLLVKEILPRRAQVTLNYTLTDWLSNLLALPDSSLFFRFQNDIEPVEWYDLAFSAWDGLDWTQLGGGPMANYSWAVQAVTRPRFSLGDLESSLRQIGEPNILTLFGVGSPRATQEPWLTFYNLWLRHPEVQYALGGLVLGLIYYTEQVRLGAL
jgi:hypothetical protein